jgi:hypothetical protein
MIRTNGTAQEPITCMHVIAVADIPAHKAVYAMGGLPPDHIPQAHVTHGDGRAFAGISDRAIKQGDHGTIVVAGVVSLYTTEPSADPTYSTVALKAFDGADESNRVVGVAVSPNTRGLIIDGSYHHCRKVMLCPWMVACTPIDLNVSGWHKAVLNNAQATALVRAVGWTDATTGTADLTALDQLGKQVATARRDTNDTTPCFVQ